jgi:hypothetical protein
MPDPGHHDPYWTLGEALDWLRSVDPTLADQTAADKLIELCRLQGGRAIGRRCDPSQHPVWRGKGKPRDEFELIPSYEWADLEFGYDQYDEEFTDDLLSIRFNRRMWADVLFSKVDLMRVLAAPTDITVGTEDEGKPSSQPRHASEAVAAMRAASQQLQQEGKIKPEMTITEQHKLVLEHLGIKENQRGYRYETFRRKVIHSS